MAKGKKSSLQVQLESYDFSHLASPLGDARRALVVLGQDPGISKYGLTKIRVTANAVTLLSHRVVKTTAKQPLVKRLELIEEGARAVYRDGPQPDLIGHELPFSPTDNKTKFGIKRGDDATLKQGMSIAAAYLSFPRVRSIRNPAYQPLIMRTQTPKMIVGGSGKAPKEVVQEMARAILGLPDSFAMSEDEWDSVAVALSAAALVFPELKHLYADLVNEYVDQHNQTVIGDF